MNKTKKFQELLQVVKKWLFLEDYSIIKVLCATYIANRLKGDPIWLMIVAPPGGSKTELIRALNKIEDIYYFSDLTPQTFLSGSKGENMGLLERLGDFKIITMKDFTTVLEMHRDKRSEILAQMREIYDGQIKKEFGTGKSTDWHGKIGLVAGVTPIIDKFSSVTSVLGERFIYYRLKQVDTYEITMRAINNTSKEESMREELQDAFGNYFNNFALPSNDIEVPEAMKHSINRLSHIVAMARSGVIRDGYSREVTFAPETEIPTRLAKQFIQLAKAFYIINGNQHQESDMQILIRLGLDCIPRKRRDLLILLYESTVFLKTTDIIAITKYLKNTTHRELQELQLLGLVDGFKETKDHNSLKWRLSDKASIYLKEAGYNFKKQSRNSN